MFNCNFKNFVFVEIYSILFYSIVILRSICSKGEKSEIFFTLKYVFSAILYKKGEAIY